MFKSQVQLDRMYILSFSKSTTSNLLPLQPNPWLLFTFSIVTESNDYNGLDYVCVSYKRTSLCHSAGVWTDHTHLSGEGSVPDDLGPGDAPQQAHADDVVGLLGDLLHQIQRHLPLRGREDREKGGEVGERAEGVAGEDVE